MKINWFRNLFKRCDHEFVFEKAIQEQNLRAGYKHTSRIFRCLKCGRREVREDSTL